MVSSRAADGANCVIGAYRFKPGILRRDAAVFPMERMVEGELKSQESSSSERVSGDGSGLARPPVGRLERLGRVIFSRTWHNLFMKGCWIVPVCQALEMLKNVMLRHGYGWISTTEWIDDR